jgi:glucose/arabinose dehydrogenase
MSQRSRFLAAMALVLVLVSAFAMDGGVIPGAGAGQAMATPDNSITLQLFLSGLTQPIFVTHAGDRSGRLFIVEQQGLIKVVVSGRVRPTPFLDLTQAVNYNTESGVLGLAFHPKYEINGRFFVYYTAKPPPNQSATVGDNTLAEFRVMPADPNVTIPNPTRILFALADRAPNHNGGTIAFSPVDSNPYIYVGLGDEGGGGDSFGNAQNTATLFGKILRINVDNRQPTPQYEIPPTNPFVGGPFQPEVWAYGFRNPYRFSFDRQTGDLFIGDVGQNLWEEIDVIPSLLAGQAGRNYGWPIREGTHCFSMSPCSPGGLVDPILEYDHSGGSCSVTGGYRYRGSQLPSLQGVYFYGDYCSGRIWRATRQVATWTSVEALDTTENISGFGEDEAGEIYIVAHGGSIFRLVPSNQVPVPTPTPIPCAASERPAVIVNTVSGGAGILQVSIYATTNSRVMANSLRSIAFTRVDNARVTIGNTVNREAPFTFTAAPGTQSIPLTVTRRIPSNKVVNVGMTITDACGPWTSLVGLGANSL